MLRVGLTGGIGSGKSEVARRLAAHGALLVDADVAAREVVAPGTPGLKRVVAAFGDEVLAPDGSLDRERGCLAIRDIDLMVFSSRMENASASNSSTATSRTPATPPFPTGSSASGGSMPCAGLSTTRRSPSDSTT